MGREWGWGRGLDGGLPLRKVMWFVVKAIGIALHA